MKTTLELPDELLVAAKKKAAESRTTLREIFARALRRELAEPRRRGRTPKIKWVTTSGGLPPGLDIADRAAMREWLSRNR